MDFMGTNNANNFLNLNDESIFEAENQSVADHLEDREEYTDPDEGWKYKGQWLGNQKHGQGV